MGIGQKQVEVWVVIVFRPRLDNRFYLFIFSIVNRVWKLDLQVWFYVLFINGIRKKCIIFSSGRETKAFGDQQKSTGMSDRPENIENEPEEQFDWLPVVDDRQAIVCRSAGLDELSGSIQGIYTVYYLLFNYYVVNTQ